MIGWKKLRTRSIVKLKFILSSSSKYNYIEIDLKQAIERQNKFYNLQNIL